MNTKAETTELDPKDTLQVDVGDGASGEEHHDDAANGSQTAAPDKVEGSEGNPNEGEDDGELEFQFGEEAPPASESQEQRNAAPWIKELRKQNVELNRKIREMEAAKQQQPQAPAVPTLGNKPKLEDFDYDEGKYDEALGQWYEDKRKVDQVKSEQESAARARQKAIDERLNGYRTEAASLRRKDFQDVESEVVTTLSIEQQGILLAGADKPALLVYALGRYPTKLRDLAQIKDPVRFAFAAAKLEKELKVTTRPANNKPAPEGRISSSSGASNAGGSEKKLEQLRAEAERTGDLSKVIAYKAQLKQAQKGR